MHPAALAQWIEQVPPKRCVTSSILVSRTNYLYS